MFELLGYGGDDVNNNYLPFKIDGIAYIAPIKYVYSILPVSENMPSCALPGRPAYVERVILTEKKLTPVIEWRQVTQAGALSQRPLRAMIVIFRYQNQMLGVLADGVAAPFTLADPRMAWDATKKHTLLICEDAQYILFDLPIIFQNLGDKNAGDSGRSRCVK